MTVHRIAAALDPALISLAQEGERHYREVFDLVRDPQDGSSQRLRSACCCAIHGTTHEKLAHIGRLD